MSQKVLTSPVAKRWLQGRVHSLQVDSSIVLKGKQVYPLNPRSIVVNLEDAATPGVTVGSATINVIEKMIPGVGTWVDFSVTSTVLTPVVESNIVFVYANPNVKLLNCPYSYVTFTILGAEATGRPVSLNGENLLLRNSSDTTAGVTMIGFSGSYLSNVQ